MCADERESLYYIMTISSANITIGFSTTNGWRSRLIRWVTHSPCSHAWISFNDDTLGLRLVMQAETWGFEVRPWSRWTKENIRVAEFSPIGPPLEESLRWIATFLGSQYDYKAAFLSGIWRWVRRGIRSRFNDPGKLMCSEGLIRFLQHGQYNAVGGLDPELTPPKKALGRVLRHPGQFSLIYILPSVSDYYHRRRVF